MNKDIAEGKWRQLKGRIQEKWGDLTDDEVDQFEGNREQFYGRLQEKYGLAREEAEEAIEKEKKFLS